jgi:cytidylate kinase
MTSGPVRIQKALADAGVASRRAADALVSSGRVTVNGRPATTGQRIDPTRDRLAVDGRPVGAAERRTYLAMAKPAGVTSTVSDRHAARTVLDLVPPEMRAGGRLYPVGRLDRDSEGLLLLTNDGDWAQGLLHPRHGVEREYAVGLEMPLDAGQADALREGVRLEEGIARLGGLRPASRTEATRLDAFGALPDASRARSARLIWYRVVIRQGWKRQVRRMLAAVGNPARRLVRVRIGSLRLGSMTAGEVRPLTSAERQRLAAETAAGPVVSIDGPASSGKSSVGAAAALRLGFRFLDTGVLYRALAWLCATRGIDPDDEGAVLPLVSALELVADEEGRLRRVRIDGRDVTAELHVPEVDRLVSRVARLAGVRSALLPLQRRIARAGRIIVAGRDIGSVVLPDADLKLYLDVSLEERARRRAADRDLRSGSPEASAIREDLRRRDEADSTRAAAPLRVPDGAVIVRSDGWAFADTVAEVVRRIEPLEGA